MKKTILLISLFLSILIFPKMVHPGYLYKLGDKISIGQYSNDFDNAITKIGSDNRVLVIDTSITVTQDVTVPANVTLEIGRDGMLTYADANVDLTINGPVMAGLYQWIDPNRDWVDFGTGAVIIGYPEWYGGAGDNSTDNHLAIEYLASSGVPKIALIDGTYLIQNTITWQSNCALEIQQGAALMLDANCADANGEHIIYGEGLSNISFYGPGTVDGNGSNQWAGTKGYCMWFKNCDDILIDGLTIQNALDNAGSCGDGVIIQAVSNDIGNRAKIVNCTIKDNGRQGIAITGQSDVVISNNTFEGNDFSHVDIEVESGDTINQILISDNVCKNNGAADAFVSKAIGIVSSYNTITDARITDNIISGCTDSRGIYVLNVNRCQVTGNTINGCDSDGILVSYGADANDVVKQINVSGNIIKDPNGHGIYVAGNASVPLKNVTVNSNQVYGAGDASSEYGIYLSGLDESIINNNIVTQSAQHGISIANCDNIQIINNLSYGNGIVAAGRGIILNTCTNILLTNNTTYDTADGTQDYGIYIDSSSEIYWGSNKLAGNATADYFRTTDTYLLFDVGAPKIVTDVFEYGDFNQGDTTCTHDFAFQFRDGTVITDVWWNLNAVFAGGTVSAATLELGITGDDDDGFFPAENVFTGAGTGWKDTTITSKGTFLNDSVNHQTLKKFISTATTPTAILRTTDGNGSALTAGRAFIFIEYVELPK